METIIAVEVTTDTDERCYFLTWGRIQDPVDPDPVARIVLSMADRFATPGKPVAARVCTTLQEAAGAPWFYEYFFGLCQTPIPFGKGYAKWRKRMDKRMRVGKEIAFAGPVRDYKERDANVAE